jgi:hypothetical protein
VADRIDITGIDPAALPEDHGNILHRGRIYARTSG